MKSTKEKILQFIRQENVLCIAFLLAVLSTLFVPVSEDYLTYIDLRVLAILLSLMIVIRGFQNNGLFDVICLWILSRVSNARQLALVLVFLCFFMSMLITNDVALIAFVPFAILTLEKTNNTRYLIPVIVFQTIAANLGSMLTPVGNPQNLYLYNISHMALPEFIRVMLPYTAISAVGIYLAVVLQAGREQIHLQLEQPGQGAVNHRTNAVYGVLFLLCLLTVLRVLPYYVVLALVLAVVALMERHTLVEVDYCLLLTFVCFFIFTGNMANIDWLNGLLQRMIGGHELMMGVLLSQGISNVPATLLTAEFTHNYRELLIGVNIGGLGTLIASMASLISYKQFAARYNRQKGQYFKAFTCYNLLGLAVLLLGSMVL